MSEYRLDRTAFKAQTAAEAADHRPYYKNLTWQERIRIAHYLNSIAYNFPVDNPPRLDRTKFKAHTAAEANEFSKPSQSYPEL